MGSSLNDNSNYIIQEAFIKNIINRFKSPFVIIQIITIIGTIICIITPEMQGVIDKFVYNITIIINVFAGINIPTDRENYQEELNEKVSDRYISS